MPGQIPQTDQLAIAGQGADSLTELMNRDPAHQSEQEFDRLIEIMRQKREDWDRQEAQAPQRRTAQKVPPRAEDIGL